MMLDKPCTPPAGSDVALRYLRDRVNVPRDMSIYAAKRLRATVLAMLPEEYFLIGDNAFTLSSKMLVPFSGAQRTQQHKDVYNYYLSQLRIRIEMAFGRMTTKWRIFRRPLDVSLAKASDIIMASMMLHNFVIENDGLVMNNLETDVRRRYGVDPLEGRDTDNNGFLPAIDDEIQVNLAPQQHPDGHRRNTILQEVIDRQLMRPHHNIERNG